MSNHFAPHTPHTCTCGKQVAAGLECGECRRKREKKAQHTAGKYEPDVGKRDHLPISNGTSNINHSFSHIAVYPAPVEQSNAPRAEMHHSFHDDDPIHRPLINEFRRREQVMPQEEGGGVKGPSAARLKYGGLLLSCPAQTELANSINLRSEALAAGFRTAYGIHAQMRVRPDERTWDGTQITEALTAGANTCPDTLTRGEPCSGGSTFTVGAPSGNSSVLSGPRPGAINRFWDFHTTHVRPRTVSVLHDPARNPAGLNTCSTVCNQQYSCDGRVIGRHTITRTYTKGVHNGLDVTFADIVKT